MTVKKLKFLYLVLICICTGCYVCGMNSISICTHIYTSVATLKKNPSMLQCTLYHFPTFSVLLLMSPDKLKKREIEMKPNQAYETVTLPCSSKPATQIHPKPCPAYEVVVQAHH